MVYGYGRRPGCKPGVTDWLGSIPRQPTNTGWPSGPRQLVATQYNRQFESGPGVHNMKKLTQQLITDVFLKHKQLWLILAQIISVFSKHVDKILDKIRA